MNEIFLIGGVGNEVTLKNTIEKVSNSNKNQPLTVNIHSQGGSVFEGLAIYNYLKSLDQEVNTHSSGLVASIASVIFLAGKNRTINSSDNFLIHLPSNISMGNAEDLEKTAKQLREFENKLADIYVNETNVTKEEAMDLMTKDEFLDVEFLKEKGFVNEIIKFQAVATIDNNFNKDMSEQLTKKDAENMFEKFGNSLKNYFNPKETAPDNKIVQDANGIDLDFKNVDAENEVQVGDEAVIDGKKANGDVTMPNGEIWKFENGILNEKVEVKQESELEKLEASLEAQINLVATLEAEKLELTNKLEVKEGEFKQIETDFTELKNTVTSSFEVDTKTEQPKKELTEKKQSFFK